MHWHDINNIIIAFTETWFHSTANSPITTISYPLCYAYDFEPSLNVSLWVDNRQVTVCPDLRTSSWAQLRRWRNGKYLIAALHIHWHGPLSRFRCWWVLPPAATGKWSVKQGRIRGISIIYSNIAFHLPSFSVTLTREVSARVRRYPSPHRVRPSAP